MSGVADLIEVVFHIDHPVLWLIMGGAGMLCLARYMKRLVADEPRSDRAQNGMARSVKRLETDVQELRQDVKEIYKKITM